MSSGEVSNSVSSSDGTQVLLQGSESSDSLASKSMSQAKKPLGESSKSLKKSKPVVIKVATGKPSAPVAKSAKPVDSSKPGKPSAPVAKSAKPEESVKHGKPSAPVAKSAKPVEHRPVPKPGRGASRGRGTDRGGNQGTNDPSRLSSGFVIPRTSSATSPAMSVDNACSAYAQADNCVTDMLTGQPLDSREFELRQGSEPYFGYGGSTRPVPMETSAMSAQLQPAFMAMFNSFCEQNRARFEEHVYDSGPPESTDLAGKRRLSVDESDPRLAKRNRVSEEEETLEVVDDPEEVSDDETESLVSEAAIIQSLPRVWRERVEKAAPALRESLLQSLEAIRVPPEERSEDTKAELEYISYKEMVVAVKTFLGDLVPCDESVTPMSPPKARSACREPVAPKDMSDSLPLANLVSAALSRKHFELVGTEDYSMEGTVPYPASSTIKSGKYTKPPPFQSKFYKIQGNPIFPSAALIDQEFSSLWGSRSCREPRTYYMEPKTMANLETSSRRCLSVISHSDWFSLAIENVIDALGKLVPDSVKEEGRQLTSLGKRLCESVGRINELLAEEQAQVLANITLMRRDGVLSGHKSQMTDDLAVWFRNQPFLQKRSLFGKVNEIATPLVTLCKDDRHKKKVEINLQGRGHMTPRGQGQGSSRMSARAPRQVRGGRSDRSQGSQSQWSQSSWPQPRGGRGGHQRRSYRADSDYASDFSTSARQTSQQPYRFRGRGARGKRRA
jgi:hypothetical protein